MSDIFREVDEEVRAQKLEAFWKRYSSFLIAGAVLLLAAVGGWRYYAHTEETAAAASAARFEEALELSRQGKPAEAQSVLDALVASGAGGYRQLARFRSTAELAAGDPVAGAKAFDALAADSALDQTLRDLARLRAAALLSIPSRRMSLPRASVRFRSRGSPGAMGRVSCSALRVSRLAT